MKRRYRTCVRRDLVLGRIYLGRCLILPLSRTYFAALAVFHSFLALKERRTQDLTKTLYMARRRRRILFFTVTEERNSAKGRWRHGDGKLASFGFWLQSHMSRSSPALAHKSQMDQMIHAQTYNSQCAFLD
jgi:hypothetical protein